MRSLERLASTVTLTGLVLVTAVSGARADDPLAVVTAAGTGSIGDGGPAANAIIAVPNNLTFDGDGDLYFAANAQQRVRRIDRLTREITTVVGTGFSPPPAGGVPIGDGGPATEALLFFPLAVAFRDGTLFLGEEIGFGNRIRTISPGADGEVTGELDEIINTVRTPGVGGLAFDAGGNLFYTQTAAVWRLDRTTGVATRVAGTTGVFGPASGDGGPATAAVLDAAGLAFEGGDLFVSDFNGRIRRIVPGVDGVITGAADELIGTVAGGAPLEDGPGDGGPATQAALFGPWSIAFRDGALFICDRGFGRVRKVVPGADGILTGAADERITTVAGGAEPADGLGDGLAATQSRLTVPSGLGFDPDGNLFIGDGRNSAVSSDRIRAVAPSPPPPYGDGDIDGDPDETITTYAGGTADLGDGGPAIAARLNGNLGVSFDGDDNLWIPDRANHRLRKVDAAAWTITTVAGTGVAAFTGDGGDATSATLHSPENHCARDAAGNVFFCDTGNNRVRRVDPSGHITTVAGSFGSRGVFDGGFAGDGGAANAARLNIPTNLALDPVSGDLFICDEGNNRVRRILARRTIVDGVDVGPAPIDGSETITPFAGSTTAAGFAGDGGPATAARLNQPAGVAVFGGSVYIADRGNHRIRKVDSSGIITTVAGTGAGTFAGDGGQAKLAALRLPTDVAFDPAGSMYIADRANQRIRRVSPLGVITTILGTGIPGASGDGGPATLARVGAPCSVAVDSAGNPYVCDVMSNRVRRLNVAGTLTVDLVEMPGKITALVEFAGAPPHTAAEMDVGSVVAEIVDPLTGAVTSCCSAHGVLADLGVDDRDGNGRPERKLLFDACEGEAIRVSGRFTDGRFFSGDRAVATHDTTPPELVCPAPVLASAVAPWGAVVTFPAPLAPDACDPDPAIACVPESGSVLPIGETAVLCTSTDASGNSSECTFPVTVMVEVAGLGAPMGALVREGTGTPPLPAHARAAGSTVPLKLTISAGSTLLGEEELAQLELEPPMLLEPGGMRAFRYDAPHWVFNWKMPSGPPGAGIGRIRMPDGLVYDFAFVLK